MKPPTAATAPELEEDATMAPGLARSAGILALGNVVSRVLGLARETVITYYFGATGLNSAFTVAATVPTMIYDLLIGGMLSAALVPVLSQYTRKEQRAELARLAGALLTVAVIVLTALVVILQVTAPWVARLLAGGFPPELLELTTSLIRWTAPSIWFFGCAGAITSILFAFRRFTFPAFATAIYNLGIVIAAPLLTHQLGVYSLAVGVLIGSSAQLLILLPELRRAGVQLVLNFYHPALRRIGVLYLPIAAGVVISNIQVIIDRNLASGTGEQSIAWMREATMLVQLPLGLISVAVSLAALPSLSQYAASGDWASFRATLGRGLRLILFLILPSAAGLYVMAEPVVRLLFERGAFLPTDTEATAAALRFYLFGLVFAAVDWPLNYAYYARQNTLTPALVGVVSVFIYLAVALWLLPQLSYLGLVLADSAKHAGHALIMLMLLWRSVGSLRGERIGVTVTKTGLAALVMASALAWLLPLLESQLPVGTLPGNVGVVLLAALFGFVFYVGMTWTLGVGEIYLLWQRLRARLPSPPR